MKNFYSFQINRAGILTNEIGMPINLTEASEMMLALAKYIQMDQEKINSFVQQRIDQINVPFVPNKKPTQQGYVYLIRNLKNNYLKIGFAKNPSIREQTLQSEEPDLSMVFSYPSTRVFEAKLHALYKDKRLRGEWFNLDDNEVSRVISLLQNQNL